MDQQVIVTHLGPLCNEYDQLRAERRVMQFQFDIVDSGEIVSTDTRDRWWKVLQDYKRREEYLEMQITELEFEVVP